MPPLTADQARDAFKKLTEIRDKAAGRLDRIRGYLRNDPHRRDLEGLPSGAPQEVRRLARLARVNMMKFVVNARVQSMYIDGYRGRLAADDEAVWDVWQGNGMDARQIGVNRAALSYGAAYLTVLPGSPMPVMRGVSPRNLTAVYGDDDLWPTAALEKRRSGWRLYDNEALYDLNETGELVETKEHSAGVCPVVRVRETDDLDDEVTGIVEPFTPLQDQINITTFGLLVAQHYGAFRQRYILGWMAASEEAKLKASASKLWTFEESPEEITVGEFSQTDLKGYIDSREASLRHLATVSQTPAHELTGQLVNLSAEALAAAEASKRQAITENQTVMGEAYEQALGLAGGYMDVEADPAAYVRWRDTESRSLAQLVDALGKAVTMLGIPPQELWPRVADAMGVSQQELESWRAAAAAGDAFANLEGLLNRQADGSPPTPEPEPVSA